MTSYYVALVVAGVMTYVVYRFLASPSGIISRPWRTTKFALNTRENRCSASSTQPTCSPAPRGTRWGPGGLYGWAYRPGIRLLDPIRRVRLRRPARGYGSVPGPLIGAIAFEFIRTYANKYAPYAWQMTLGIIMLLIILLQPGGCGPCMRAWSLASAAVPKEWSVPEPGPILQTIDLTKSFGMVKAADAINVHITRGELVGIVGANGSGKTTFLNLITGYLQA